MEGKAIGMSGYNQTEFENELWSFVFATVDDQITFGGKPPSGKLSKLFSRVKTIAKHKFGFALVANPYFVLNGICDDDDEDSPLTASYLRSRLGKTGAGAGVSLAGSAAKSITVVDPIAMGRAGISIGATIAHIKVFSELARKWKQSKTITDWVECLLFFKGLKLGGKSIALASAAIPYMPAGVDTALSMAGNALTGAGLAVTGSGFVLPTVLGVRRIAIELHWRAYREHVISHRGGAVGPASAILTELFTKRTHTAILGQYEVDGLIKEPAGWMAIEDKIALL
jgi:hypothetical protein